MAAQTRTKLGALLLIAVLTLVLGLVQGAAEQRRIEAQNAGRAARSATVAVSDLLVSLLDAETGLRGYLLTRDPEFLEPYLAGHARVEAELERVERVIDDDDDRMELRRIVSARLEELESNLGLARAGEFERAVERVRDGDGRSRMDQARALLARVSERHEARRTAALEEREYYEAVVRFVTFGGLAAVALLVVVVWFGIRRDLVRQEEQQVLIQDQARELAVKSEGLETLARNLEEHNASLASANRALEVAGRERQRAILDLERRNRDLDQFAYVTSHDLKAPLRAIANLATWIDEDLPPTTTPETRENLELLKQRTARMEMLIEGILAYSRAGRTKNPGARKSMDAVVAETRVLLGLSTDHLRLEQGGELLCPPESVEFGQVLTNLVSNAQKHGGAGKPIHVTAARTSDALELSVRDHGPGIEPRFHERIFEIFQTLSPRDAVEGAGIGLAIVKKLVLGVDGKVWVESEPGKGATFHVRWPIAEASSEHRGAA